MRVAVAFDHHGSQSGELGLDALVGGGVAPKLRQSDPKNVLALLHSAVSTMGKREVRHDPSLVLAVTELTHGRGSLLEQCRRFPIVSHMAHGEREVVLGQRDGS